MNAPQLEMLGRAIEMYNRGRFFECQAVLEELHNACDDEHRPLVRSLTMMACGMHIHFQRGGGRGALNLLRQSLVILDDLRPHACGVATGPLYEELFAYVEDLQGRGKPGAGFFDRWLVPKLRFVPPDSDGE